MQTQSNAVEILLWIQAVLVLAILSAVTFCVVYYWREIRGDTGVRIALLLTYLEDRNGRLPQRLVAIRDALWQRGFSHSY